MANSYSFISSASKLEALKYLTWSMVKVKMVMGRAQQDGAAVKLAIQLIFLGAIRPAVFQPAIAATYPAVQFALAFVSVVVPPQRPPRIGIPAGPAAGP